jgi:uncharacterized membrane protein YphA (DoxX/SURF4 family)
MDGLLLSARCLLAAVFLVASIGKLLDLEGSRQALTEFGVPKSLARFGGSALPVAELLVAVALILRPAAVPGAVGGLVLLVVFIVGVGYAISQDRAPDCHCFGQLHSEPAGRSTLVRNAVLAALAVLIIAAGPGPALDGALAGLHGAQIALVATSVLAAALVVLVAQLLGDKRGLQTALTSAVAAQRKPGLARGSRAPEFDLVRVRGEAGSLADLLSPPRPAVLVFVSATCEPCKSLLTLLGGWQGSLAEAIALPAIFTGDRDEVTRLCEEHDLHLALSQEANETFTDYELRGTPSAVLVDANGVIATAPAEGVPAIEALVRNTISSTRIAPQLAIHRG